MKTLYLECNMGAAGDMIQASLLELIDDKQAFLDEMNGLGIPGVRVEWERVDSHGIYGSLMHVFVGGQQEETQDITDCFEEDKHVDRQEKHSAHAHSSLLEIENLIASLGVSPKVKADAIAVYRIIAEAEAYVHGRPVSEVHFHEVGSLDAVADIVGVCLLMEMISPQRVVVSPIHVGYGHVRCAHGVLPVPAPATAYILRGIPTYGKDIQGELCTPTGAALLKHFADGFDRQPLMNTFKIGYGMGKKKFPVASFVRSFLGAKQEDACAEVAEVLCNVDDMTGEEVGFAQEKLWEAGALDVYTVPIQMKKNRPGQKLCCICNLEDREKIVQLLLQHTTTFGVRTATYKRYCLDREFDTIDTAYGKVNIKHGSGYGVKKQKTEYEDIKRIAKEQDISFEEVQNAINKAIVTKQELENG